ncbi:hypothetical protein ACHAXR_011585 [Thalassiosira sp. AJA248-18]
MVSTLRNTVVIGACCASSAGAFAPSSSGKLCPTALRSSNNGSSGPQQGFPSPRGRPLDDPFAPSPRMANGPPPSGPRRAFEDPPSIDLDGQVQDRQSNLFHRRTPSVNEDPRGFDMDRRFSQRPNRTNGNGDPSMQPRQAWWESTPDTSGRIQGGSRHTYDAPVGRDASHVFMESDGRPLDVEFELWDGPNNTPTRMKVYSEDGRMRPINAMVENPRGGSQGGSMRGNTLSVKNTGPMEFPINAGVSSIGDQMMSPSGVRGGGLAGSEGAYTSERDVNGFNRPSPSTSRGETVQGGALRTFPLDYSVEAVQVTITTEGMPMNAKVELWGTSSHIKQLAEIYNDNGQTRPFAAIIDVPGGSNTVAVYNTGPMEYPIRVVVEPIARMEGWDGKEEKFGGSLAPW